MPVVEVTTSLSNRVIQLKPVVRPTPRTTSKEADLETMQRELERKLAEVEELRSQAELQAKALLEDAEREIAQKKNSWEEERLSLMSEAEDEGFAAGLKEGRVEGKKEYSSLLEQANMLIQQAGERHDAIVRSSEETIVELAITCAERIVGSELSGSIDAFLGIVKQAVAEVKEQPEIFLYVPPDQYGFVVAQQEELHMITRSKARLTVYVDEDAQPFSCIVETPFGRVDASLDQQLKELRSILYEVVNEELSYEKTGLS